MTPTDPRAFRRPPLAWLPVPLLLAAIVAGRAAGLRETYQNDALRLVLSFTFYTLVSLGTLFLFGRSFLASGSPGVLLLECGVVLWSLAGTVGDLFDRGDANVNVTIFNTGILLAGLCHLAGSILSLRPQRTLRAKGLWLAGSCALALVALGLVTWAATAGWLPVFFIPGRGGTTVRYAVLTSAIAVFLLSAGLLLAGRRAARLPFTSWYALALLALAVGLLGIMIQLSLWSVVNWLSRTAQWLGGLYLLLAAVAALRESSLPLLPPGRQAPPAHYRDAMAVVVVLVAAALRLAFLSAMGKHSPFVVFYPAVVFAAIYGGLRAGLLATALSAALTGLFWIPAARPFAFTDPADWLGILIFLVSGALIAGVTEAMHRARARAAAAETQALLAAQRQAAAEALRESEERYHSLFTGMTEGFAIHDLVVDEAGTPVDYRFLDINPAFERLTGLKRQDVIGRTHNEVLPGDDPKWLAMYSQVALTGQPVQFDNYAPTLKRHYEVFAYCPAPMQFAVVFMDITDRKRAEESLRRTAEDLARSNKDLEHFAYVASHDLQEPLRQVQAFVQMLRDRHADKLEGRAAEYMQFVSDGAARMSNLVQGLLEYSRVGAKDARKRPVACGEALDAAVANLQAAIGESGAAVTRDDLPTVLAEGTQLTQLFQNLIGNAVKFRRDGVAPEIHVGARRDGGRWCLWVKDNGIGIDPKFQEKVFLIFQRLHTREKYPGTGIGLAICKKIVEQHGGRIWIESIPGEGATFYFTLPGEGAA